MAYDTDDIIEKRRRRHRQHTFRNILIFLLLACFCVFLYLQRDAWIPKLEGIGSRYETVTQNDGELAEGNFPLTISNASGYQAAIVSDTLFLLHDAYLDVYSIHGDTEDSRQHAFQNESMCAADGKYVLVYEREGSSFRVDTKSKNVYSKTVDEDIISGVISSSGSVALITESSSYACSIVVYDNTGKRIYQRDCTERVIDIAFHDDDEGCYFTMIDAESGVIQSTVHSILFEQVDIQWTGLPLETLVVKSGVTSDNTLCIIGNSACAYYNNGGALLSSYTYTGTLVSASVENGKAALLIADDQQREISLILMNGSANDPTIVSVDTSASYLTVTDGDAIVMSDDNITSYSFSGTAIATVALDGSYDSFLKQDGYVLLLGYNQIDRVDFKE